MQWKTVEAQEHREEGDIYNQFQKICAGNEQASGE
jgi:hypothetical protein